jgi:hypothetical protein
MINFTEQFDNAEVEEFRVDKAFKDTHERNSMIALSIIAMLDEKYMDKFYIFYRKLIMPFDKKCYEGCFC